MRLEPSTIWRLKTATSACLTDFKVKCKWLPLSEELLMRMIYHGSYWLQLPVVRTLICLYLLPNKKVCRTLVKRKYNWFPILLFSFIKKLQKKKIVYDNGLVGITATFFVATNIINTIGKMSPVETCVVDKKQVEGLLQDGKSTRKIT